ncbi:MAG: SUMF1/EgtB/PvdO family nonheme iron enzyme [Polyangiaceae bacterium]
MTAVDTFGLVGTVIAEKYRVDRVVDEGGFSLVYKAEHLIWREPVALKCFKVLASAPVDQRDALLDAFIQEGKLMTSLSSRSAAIVQARDIGKLTTADGQWLPYIVMEWLDGKPLDVALYEEGKHGLPPRNIVETMALLESAAVAFETCHARGIAHRDIKPGNLIVMGDPRGPSPFVKVLDFGIAKVMAEHAAQTTASAHTGKDITAFTPNYGAPEQFSRSHGATGPWTDVFAMALIAVEVLRGGHPALDGDDFLQLGMASRDPMRRPSPRAFGVPVSDAVEAVFLRALAVDPEHRFKTMGQFWTALHQAVFPDAGTWTGSAGLLQRASLPGVAPSAAGMQPYSPGSMPYPGAPPSFSPAAPSIPAGQAPSTGGPMYAGAPPSMSPVPGAPTTPPYAGAPQYGASTPQYGAPSAPQYGPSTPQYGAGPSTPQYGAGQSTPQYGAPAATPYGGVPAAVPPTPTYQSAPQGPLAPPTGAPATFQPAAPPPASGARKGLFAAGALLAAAAGAVIAFKVLGAATGPGPAASASVAVTATASVAVTAPATSTAAAPGHLTECPAGMILVPGGKFFMGSDEPTFKLWQPAHKVQLDTFCIGMHEVTTEEYRMCSDKGECKRPLAIPSYPKMESSTDAEYEKARNELSEMCNFGKAGRDKHPINCVTWEMAQNYCKVNDSRLPTEAEWEFAARGSDGRTYPWGDDPAREKHMNACGKECNAWEKAHGLKLTPPMYAKDDGYPGTSPVGSFPEGKTRLGIDDMVGNVWEWTADYFEIYKPDEVLNPKGPAKGDRRAIRGGGWNGGVALWLNPAFRYHQVEDAAAPALGFRCARSL